MSVSTFMKKVALSLQGLALVMGFGLTALGATAVMSTPAYAAPADCNGTTFTLQNGADCSAADGTRTDLFGAEGIFRTVANTLIFLIGAISVIFLIVGGLRYVISQGEAKNVTAAKDTILYAIVGIVVAVISYALVNFVIAALAQPAA